MLKSVPKATAPGEINSSAIARVLAEAAAERHNDRAIEQVVGCLSLEPSVAEALWRIAEADDD